MALLVFVLDQLTKFFIKTHIGPLDIIQVTSFFNIVHTENTGSAFGLFKSLGNLFFIVTAFIAMVFVTFLIIKDHKPYHLPSYSEALPEIFDGLYSGT